MAIETNTEKNLRIKRANEIYGAGERLTTEDLELLVEYYGDTMVQLIPLGLEGIVLQKEMINRYNNVQSYLQSRQR